MKRLSTVLDDCQSIAASTDEILWSDDDTIVADMEDVWNQDLAAMRRLLESEGSSGGGSTCPSCEMPFDKGKKRKLIDTCGHERCYSCMFTNEICPICTGQVPERTTDGLKMLGSSGFRGSEITLYGDASRVGCTDRLQSRPKVKTNGHFTTFMQSRQTQESPNNTLTACNEWPSPTRLPKTRPTNPRRLDSNNAMVQSCPTPPQSRRRFFLSPKAIRSPFGSRTRQPADVIAMSASTNESSKTAMISSTVSEGRGWPKVSAVLGKIKSLWSAGGANVGLNALADDEGGNVKPAMPRKTSQNDLYMRLGLLLGDGAARRARRGVVRSSHESCSSLASYDPNSNMSANTSPVSTLTGSSEDQHRNNPSSDSVHSLMSVSASGHSNCSNSPVSRRHSVTTQQQEERDLRGRRTAVRRSNRSPAQQCYRGPQLTLKPLFFEVPQQEPEPLFVGRQWLLRDMEDLLASNNSGVLISGSPGTGKTALILQLVEHSCFGRRKISSAEDSNDRLRKLASSIVAYHFCQADNNNTCLVPDWIHSVAAQLCQSPQLTAYRDYLLSEPHLQGVVSLRECIADPDLAFTRGVLEPLSNLRRLGKIENRNCIILVDALCEAEYHRPDTGDTLVTFLAKHSPSFPTWLKVVATVRTQLSEITKGLPYARASIDVSGPQQTDGNFRDLVEYITMRTTKSPTIQSNAAGGGSGVWKPEKFATHVAQLSQGSFLYTKLTLDLLEQGQLVAKSANYSVLPVNLAQIFCLHFNLRFPTARSFEKVEMILSVCLAALYPLTLLEIYYSINALQTESYILWDEFIQRFKLLSGFLVKRLDNTYMFFHPSFREWLMRRDDNDSSKFVCDLRIGHAAIAFRLSRVQAPLDADKTLELGHHVLKAHVYRNVQLEGTCARDAQAAWVAASSENTSVGLCALRNVYSPNVKVSRLLLLAGADPDYRTDFLGSAPALCMFASVGNVPMVALLLEFGSDVELTNSQGSSALSLAATRGHCDVVRRLVAAGASPGHADTSGRCALVHAARAGNLNVVGYLLACDWPASARPDDVTLQDAAAQALVAAAAHGHADIVEYLLDMADAVNPDGKDPLTGETALTAAASAGSQPTCTALLTRGAGPAVTNVKRLAALHVAARDGHWGACERLLQHEAPIEQPDSTGRTALSHSAGEGHVGVTELLLERGAILEQPDRDGLTPLGWACLRGRVQTAQCLLDHGADVNYSDKTGRTPLDLAAFQGSPPLVQLLLDRGALVEHVDINGMRPLDRAVGCRNLHVVHCFLRKGAKLGPATWAMAQGKPDIILVLLNKLLEDGNVLYRKGRLKEAAHRYQYALKKFPTEESGEHSETFAQLRINFLLNQSRCKRKMNETDEAVELAEQALSMKSDSYEAYYARAKALMDLGRYDEASLDVREALRLAPVHGLEVKTVLNYLREEISMRMTSPSVASRGQLAASVDTLNHN